MLKYFWAAERAINKLIAYPKPILSIVRKSIFEYIRELYVNPSDKFY